MKKVFVSLLVLMFAASAFAATSPIDKGSMILEGDIYFQTKGGDLYKDVDENGVVTENETESQTVMVFSPTIGYFVAPSIMVGVMVNFETSKIADANYEYKETKMGFGPMVGYYFNMDKERTDVKGAMYPYIKAFFLYSSCKQDYNGTEFTDKIMSFGGMGGVVFMLSNAVAVDFGVMFRSDKQSLDDAWFEDEDIPEDLSGTVIQVGAGISAFIY
ncbi:MAG: outer membrane beta-barrel protein [bacterium]